MCSHLHTLRITYTDRTNFFSILPCISRRLRVLCIGGAFLEKEHILAISDHCIGLTELGLDYNFVEGSLQPLWESLGSTLTELSIGELFIRTRNQSDSLLHEFGNQKEIAEICKMLTHFRIYCPVGVALHNVEKVGHSFWCWRWQAGTTVYIPRN